MNKSNNIYLSTQTEDKRVTSLNLLSIDFKKLVLEEKYDAIIFTSKNAIKSAISSNIDLSKYELYCISKSTANELLQYNYKAKYIGKKAHGDEFALEILPLLKNKKVVFLKALKVISNLVQILKQNGIFCDEIVAYETTCSKKEKVSLKDNAIVIFTSPSSIKCFFEKYEWKDSYKAICIGKTTQKYLPLNINYTVSPKTTIRDCIELASTF